jgi:hypothetical protein
MVKAKIQNGAIVPLEPLPPEWGNGTEVAIEVIEEPQPTGEEIDRWFEELEQLCVQGSEEDHQRLQNALEEADRLAKEQMRREMGLP